MAAFILYLFEAGLCLSILFLVYQIFFRKETYFNFNRFYLLGIMFISLSLPLVHISFTVSSTSSIYEPVGEIGKFRSYYTGLISMSEYEFSRLPYIEYEAAVFEDNESLDMESVLEAQAAKGERERSNQSFWNRLHLSPAHIILWIYSLGVLFFLIRLLYLSRWLWRNIKHNTHQKLGAYTLVLLNSEIPPFSFLKYIFINKEATKLQEYEQIIAHECIHVKQRHSVDLLIANGLTVFMWFNPLAWQLQKAIKTTHEYIADSKVVGQGYELFDYQSLLLRQLVGIPSIGLVNNLNLLFIKKRMIMMTKKKSGMASKMKALLIIPAALAVFIVFANLTVKSPLFNFTNYNTIKSSNLEGIWENTDHSSYGQLILFKDSKLSVLEKYASVDVLDIDIEITENEFIILNNGQPKGQLKYAFEDQKLKIWWHENKLSVYTKTKHSNSAEALAPKQLKGIQLPTMSESKILERSEYIYNIYIYPNKYFVEDKAYGLDDLKLAIKKRVSKFNVLDRPYATARLYVDQNTDMKAVYQVYGILRELDLLKIGFATLPSDETSELQYHASALPQKLPPLGKDKLIIKKLEKVKDRVIVLKPEKDIHQLETAFMKFVIEKPNYIANLQYHNNSKYGDYLAVIDMSYRVIYKLRDKYAFKNHGLRYVDLPEDLQKEVRKQYPMRISQRNLDED